MATQFENEFKAMRAVHEALKPLKAKRKTFVLRTVTEQLGLPPTPVARTGELPGNGAPRTMDSSTSAVMPREQRQEPKRFLASKKPGTHVEQVVCLGWYLTKIKGVRAFKTREISNLNVDAAGRVLTSPSMFVKQAVQNHYFASAGKGKSQITDLGERVVDALPDRTAVKVLLKNDRAPRRRSYRRKKSRSARG